MKVIQAFFAQAARVRGERGVNRFRCIEHRLKQSLFGERRIRLVIAGCQKAAEVLARKSAVLIVR